MQLRSKPHLTDYETRAKHHIMLTEEEIILMMFNRFERYRKGQTA